MFLSARSGAVLLGLMIIGAAQPGGTAERTRRPASIGAVEVTDRFWALRVGESRQGRDGRLDSNPVATGDDDGG